MAPKTQARSNLARSAAARSGWPVLQGYKVKLFALSNVARSGATRSNYTSNQTFISIGGVPVPGRSYSELVVADGASHYWRLNEKNGTTAVDLIGAANGTISGGVTLNQPGALADPDTAMTFNGTTGKIATAANVALLTPLTLEAWFKTTQATGTLTILSNRAAADLAALQLTVNNGQPFLWFQAGSGGTANRTVSDGQWHHLAWIVMGTSLWIAYIDGAVVPIDQVANVFAGTAAHPLSIGWDSQSGTQGFVGSLDEVAIYPVALTAAQIAAHYQLGRNGIAAGGILVKSVTVNDSLNDVPSSAQLTFYKYVPVEGSDVVITLGSKNNLRREFGGTVLNTSHQYVGDLPIDRNMVYPASLIDYAWGLNRKKYSGKFQSASVATIASTIVAAAAPGYTLYVAPDIAAVIINEMTFTEQTAADALHQLVKRVGGDWFCDYLKVIQLFFDFTADTPPTILNRAHTTFRDLQWSRDLSQVVSRVYCECGGSDALETVAAGATLIPVGTAAWYEVGGGTVLTGQQRVKYTGVVVGGGGSLVGPGAAPTGAPNASLAPGAGVDVGTHDYAVSFKTASGESIVGPRVTVPVGIFLAPTTAPTTGAAGPGVTGPDPGVHDYAVSFVISSGETVPGPRVVGSTDLTPAPTTGPTPTAGAVGVGPDPGTHDYAVSFVTATGQTPAGPIGSQITIANTPIPAPTVGPTTNPATSGGNVDVGDHWYYLTFMTANGETNTSPTTKGTALPVGPIADPTGEGMSINRTASGTNTVFGSWNYYSFAYRGGGGETLRCPSVEVQPQLVSPPPFNTFYNIGITVPASPDPAVTGIVLYRSFGGASAVCQIATFANVQSTFVDNGTVFGPAPPTGGNNTVSTGAKQTIPLTAIPTGPAGTTARRIYRTPVGGGVQRLLTTINNNSSTTYNDTTADSAMVGQPGPPGSNTALVLTAVHLSGIPRGTGASADAVLSRNLYRRSGGAGLKYVATLNDNSATTYDDTKANASLGVPPFDVNTATLRQIPLSNIPLGNALVTARKIYRTVANAAGSTLKLVGTIAENITTTFIDAINDAALGAAALTVGTAQAAQVQLASIPLGAAAVTARVIYRTKVGASQLQLLKLLNDNTTTTWLDIATDATLGANAPISDTSLLQQPTGNVLAGSASLPCATVASFLASGGWAIAASQIIRYTGITGNSLTGIPPTGPGSIGATLTYNVTVVAASMLTGIPTTGSGTILYPVVKGDAVNVFVQEDDFPAQAAIRIQLPGSDGIIEDEIQDRRLSATEGRARARARLNMLASLDSSGQVGIVSVTYTCRDINTRAGRPIDINIGPPINLLGTFMIQRVTVSKFYVPNQPPTYTVEASSVRFSYEEFLRFIRDAGE